MTTTTHNPDTVDRWTLIQHYWTHEYTWLWLLPGVVLGFAAGFFIHGQPLIQGAASFLSDLMPELFGIALTVSVLYRYEQGRDTRRDEKRLMEELPRQAKSRSNDRALAAIEEMRERGWLSGQVALLKGTRLLRAKWQEADLHEANLSSADLLKANLSGAHLAQANLSGAMLWHADLTGAQLREANLSGAKVWEAKLSDAGLSNANLSRADLWKADLTGARLEEANLSGAKLREAKLSDAGLLNANLSRADLRRANLSGANLWKASLVSAKLGSTSLSGADLLSADLSGADLMNADLSDARLVFVRKVGEHSMLGDLLEALLAEEGKMSPAQFAETTILPDGTHWTPDTDMTRFTDPAHPEFWRSDRPESPAYRGKAQSGG